MVIFAISSNSLNEDRGTTYALKECQDVAACGTSSERGKQPEVLVTGSQSEQPMVIERKQVVSETYAKNHANQHLIYETIPELLLSHLNGDLYALEVDDCDLRDKPKRRVQAEAEEIVDYVRARRGLVMKGQAIAGNKPFPWQFGRVHLIDRDESMPDTGIGVHIKTRNLFSRSRLSLIEQTCAEYKVLADLRLAEAAPKFETYLDHRKVVVLEFYCDWWLLDDDDARQIVSEAELPPLIDEVWITIPEWVSESDYEIAYEQVR
ncbi:MAG: hypothetical protein ACREBG_29465 [Pyrinomonadaceae bacterium]